MNRGYFDADGKCVVIYSGAGEPPAEVEGLANAEVPSELSPNTCELVAGQVIEKARELLRPGV